MTKERVIELAKSCGIKESDLFGTGDIERFATLVRNAALEEAKQKCMNYPEWAHWGQTDNYVIANKGAQDCAAAIESLKEPTP